MAAQSNARPNFVAEVCQPLASIEAARNPQKRIFLSCSNCRRVTHAASRNAQASWRPWLPAVLAFLKNADVDSLRTAPISDPAQTAGQAAKTPPQTNFVTLGLSMTGFCQTTSGHPTSPPDTCQRHDYRYPTTRGAQSHERTSIPYPDTLFAHCLPPTTAIRQVAHHVVGWYVDPAMTCRSCLSPMSDATAGCRVQEKCQPRDDAGDDEDRCALLRALPVPPRAGPQRTIAPSANRPMRQVTSKRQTTGIMKSKNGTRHTPRPVHDEPMLRSRTGASVQWRLRPCGYRKRRRDTWIPCEVRVGERHAQTYSA